MLLVHCRASAGGPRVVGGSGTDSIPCYSGRWSSACTYNPAKPPRTEHWEDSEMRTLNLPTDPQTDMDIVYLHDDTEEDLVGSDLHQEAIHTVHQSLKLIGRRRALPWHVSNQLMVYMGSLSGKEWRPSPDVIVHVTAGTVPLTSLNAAVQGAPELVVEVA